MKSLDLKIPPLLLAAICAALMWGVTFLAPDWRFDLPIRNALAVALALLGAGIALAGVVAFRLARTTVNPLAPHAASALVHTGIYRWTRNPMYLGVLVALLGWAVHLAHPLPFLLLPVFVLYLNRHQIAPEESALRTRFGSEFDAYCTRVRRWL